MIKMKLYGGIGNQLFQWAYAKRLSLDNDMIYQLDDSHYELCKKHFYALDQIPGIKNECIISRDNTANIILEDPFHYIPLPRLRARNLFYTVYFDGYWQSEKYFENHKDTIYSLLKPVGDIKDRLLLKYGNNLTNSVSIHVRRSDYLNSNGFHPVLGPDYYKKALEIVGDVDNILIFSDDISWCKETFRFDQQLFVEGNTNLEDLWLMSMCNHNIIANSSFSWWGSWLNKKENKIVVAPNKWFGDFSPEWCKEANPRLIYLDNWILV